MSNHKSTESALKNLEVQVGQLAKQIADKSSNSFVENREKNPKEECKAVMTRSKRFVEAEDEESVGHKNKAAEKKGTDGKKNEVRGESNQEKEKQIMPRAKPSFLEPSAFRYGIHRAKRALLAKPLYLQMASRKRARTDDIPSSSIPAPQSAAIEPDVQHPLLSCTACESWLGIGQSYLWIPPSPPLIIISDALSDEAADPPYSPPEETANSPASPVGGIADLSDSSSGEVVALTEYD
ncbi:hypothetical protein HKD37_U057935 [Glycine soja]